MYEHLRRLDKMAVKIKVCHVLFMNIRNKTLLSDKKFFAYLIIEVNGDIWSL